MAAPAPAPVPVITAHASTNMAIAPLPTPTAPPLTRTVAAPVPPTRRITRSCTRLSARQEMVYGWSFFKVYADLGCSSIRQNRMRWRESASSLIQQSRRFSLRSAFLQVKSSGQQRFERARMPSSINWTR